MHRTTDDDWQTVYQRIQRERQSKRAPVGPQAGLQAGPKTAQRMGGVLAVSRRRKHERLIALLLLFLLACSTIGAAALAVVLWGAGEVQAAQPNPALPAVVADAPAPVSLPQTVPDSYQHTINILLLGSDQREDDPGFRTDVILLVTLDPVSSQASVVSFPRDLWVEPPDLYPMKINMVQALGGFDALANTFQDNFGVRPDFYVLINFRGFTDLIDRLNGIQVHTAETLTDSCDLPQIPGGVCSVGPGPVIMDGPMALWYVRSRHTSSDYDRLRRAQEVAQAVFHRAMHLDALTRVPQLYTDFRQDFETNLAPGDIVALTPLAVRLFQEPERISRYVINEDQATPAWSWDGLWILLPDYDAIRSLLQEAGV